MALALSPTGDGWERVEILLIVESIVFRNVEFSPVELLVSLFPLSLFQCRFLELDMRVGELRENKRDGVESGALLVVGVDNMPGCVFGV